MTSKETWNRLKKSFWSEFYSIQSPILQQLAITRYLLALEIAGYSANERYIALEPILNYIEGRERREERRREEMDEAIELASYISEEDNF